MIAPFAPRREGGSQTLATPRVVVAGLSGDSGKTLVALGLVRALSDRGLTVLPAKKGPDFIDPAWLEIAAGRPCRTLDTYLMDAAGLDAALAPAAGADLLVVEGNRGLFDGLDADGTHSTAELAKRLRAPVVLVVDATKTTRTLAAMVLGCRTLDPDLELAGVILNRVGSARHARVATAAIEGHAHVPVLGAIPRLEGDDPMPGRHLGLVTAVENPRREEAVERAARAVSEHLDLGPILASAESAPPLELRPMASPPAGASYRVGVFTDPAFSFYYPDNLERLEAGGAVLVPVEPGRDETLAPVDAVYIGGGFPEVHVARLAANRSFAEALRRQVEGGLPVYAECGGLMYLARSLRVDGVCHPMAGVLDVEVDHTSRPRGHGYVRATVDRSNPFAPAGAVRTGHEFHYSHVTGGNDVDRTVLRLDRGVGIADGRDGIVRGSVWASYLHVHALGQPDWSDGLTALARTAGTTRASWA